MAPAKQQLVENSEHTVTDGESLVRVYLSAGSWQKSMEILASCVCTRSTTVVDVSCCTSLC